MNHSSQKHTSRRIAKSLAVLAVLTCGLFAACGDPDVEFVPTFSIDGGDAAETSTPSNDDGGTDGSANALSDVAITFDAPGDDASVATRDAAKLEAGAPCPGASPCDCDNDGYKSMGDACAGNDCDDLDPLRHPTQTFVAEPPEPNDGNWDCVNPIEKQYTEDLQCGSVLTLACNSAEGFVGHPKCGEEDFYIHCKTGLGLLGCTSEDAGKRRQGCK